MPEWLARRALAGLAVTGAAAQGAQAQPEQVQAAEHAEDVEHGIADLPRPDNRHQGGTAPEHVAQQMPAEKSGTGTSAVGGTDTQHRQHAGPRRDAVDKT
ncbi:hypothetical protein D3C86_1849030 [compost metagenome]